MLRRSESVMVLAPSWRRKGVAIANISSITRTSSPEMIPSFELK
jgi:hypothetical protein